MQVEQADHQDTRRLLAGLSGLRADTMAPPPMVAAAGGPGRGRFLGPVVIACAIVGGAVWWHQARPAPAAPAPVAAPAGVKAPVSSAGVLEASGFIVAKRQATVSASLTGRIVRLNVEEGSFVRRGQTIAELDGGIFAAQVAYAEAGVRAAEQASAVTKAKLRASRRNLSRSENLAERGFVSQASLDQSAETADSVEAQMTADLGQVEVARKQLALQREQLRSLNVVAPFDGVVTELAAHVGEIVSPISGGGGFTRTGICTIVDPASLEGEVDVNEQYLGRLQPGQPVSVRLPAYPGVAMQGRIAVLPNAVDRNTAAVKVRIGFDGSPPQLKPGMRADFTFLPTAVAGSAETGERPRP